MRELSESERLRVRRFAGVRTILELDTMTVLLGFRFRLSTGLVKTWLSCAFAVCWKSRVTLYVNYTLAHAYDTRAHAESGCGLVTAVCCYVCMCTHYRVGIAAINVVICDVDFNPQVYFGAKLNLGAWLTKYFPIAAIFPMKTYEVRLYLYTLNQ